MVFGLVHLAPFDPARYFVQFRQGAREEQMRGLRAWYGLDDPVPVQYLRWLGRAAVGDYGRSVSNGREVGPELFRRMPWSLLLVGTSLGLAWVLSVPLAVASAAGGLAGRVGGAAVTGGTLLPVFLLSSVLVYTFAVRLTWIPILPPFELRLLDFALWRSLLLPSVSLALPVAALIAGALRRDLAAGLTAAYTTTARAKGLSRRKAVWRHAARIAITSLLVRPLPTLSAMFGAMLVVEEIFGWPGMGRVFMRAIAQRDITAVQASLFLLGAMVLGAECLARTAVGRRVLADLPPDDHRRLPGHAAPLAAPGARLWIPLVASGVIVLGAIAAPVLVRFPPDQVLLEEIQLPPSWRHWMGTDASGRDLYSRLLFSGRATLGLALAPAAVATLAGLLLGGLSVWQDTGWGDAAAAVARAVMAVPVLALALSVVIVTGRAPVAIGTVFVAFGLAQVAGRLKALVAAARQWTFVQAGLAAGAPPAWIGERHLLPHLARPLLAECLGLVPGFVLLEATLGFFGYSLSPTIPTWGTMLWRGREALHRGDWWLLAFPVGFVMVASWGFMRLAEALREPAPPTYVVTPKPVLGRAWGPAAAGRRVVASPALARVRAASPRAPHPAAVRSPTAGPLPGAPRSPAPGGTPADGGANGGSSA
ncbi:MAG: ABC transporter permease subunit [Armatimonadetes bacterium]|nr:ABC transporter permease subunit [Armatimonadota bacterium]